MFDINPASAGDGGVHHFHAQRPSTPDPLRHEHRAQGDVRPVLELSRAAVKASIRLEVGAGSADLDLIHDRQTHVSREHEFEKQESAPAPAVTGRGLGQPSRKDG